MKKMLFTFALSAAFISGVSAQMLSQKIGANRGGSVSLIEKINKKETEKASGSPYVFKTASLGTVDGVTETLLLKYNAYSDEMEVNKGDDKTFILPKNNEFGTVTFKNTNSTYHFFNYRDKDSKEVNGYLIEKVSNNGVALLKREKIILVPEKEAATSYSVYTPPKYERVSDEYYLQTKDNRIISFPKNKKKLIEIFPQQKAAIEAHFKTNDLSFKEESDMKKIIEFISTL